MPRHCIDCAGEQQSAGRRHQELQCRAIGTGYIVAKTDFSALQIFSMVQGGVTGEANSKYRRCVFVDMDSLVKILTGKSAALPSGASPAFAGMTASRWADAAKDLGAHSAALAATPQSRATIEIEIDRVAKSPHEVIF